VQIKGTQPVSCHHTVHNASGVAHESCTGIVPVRSVARARRAETLAAVSAFRQSSSLAILAETEIR
jgi:hypothetical protein